MNVGHSASQHQYDRELALRSHIRDLLLYYALTHITTNYVLWTQNAVSELLSDGLRHVSTIDPTDPLLPADSNEALFCRLDIDKLSAFNEHWDTHSEIVEHIKRYSRLGKLKPTQRCWEDKDADFVNWKSRRPMSPILSMRAMRETPKPGCCTATQELLRPQSELLKSYHIETVSEELIPTPDIDVGDALNLKLVMDPSTHTDVLRMLKSAHILSKRSDIPPPTHVESFLRAESPPFAMDRLASPPLFPRYSLLGQKPGPKLPITTMQDLPRVLPKVDVSAIVQEEEELYKQHMIVVNGWQAYEISSSPPIPRTPSLDSNSSEVDELLMSSPETKTTLAQAIESAKMVEYIVPRTGKPGGCSSKHPMLGEGQSLGSFLNPLLRHAPSLNHDKAKIVTTPRSHPSSPHTSITMSMLGQPPSVDEVILPRGLFTYDQSSDDLDAGIQAMVEKLGGEISETDVKSIVLKEKIDDREGLLMDLPILPPPNEHATDYLPSNLSDLIAPPKALTVQNSEQQPQTGGRYIKKVKGVQSLNMELSWRPFKYGSSVPTNEEVAGVSRSIEDVFKESLRADNAHSLMSSLRRTSQLCSGDTADCEEPLSQAVWHSEEPLLVIDDPKSTDVILSRPRDHLRSVTADDPQFSDTEDQPAEGLVIEAMKCGNIINNASDYLEASRYEDDPSVYVTSPFKNQGTRFSDLSFGAEGFDGPAADGDLFPDLDPIHNLRSFPSSSPLTQSLFDNGLPSSASPVFPSVVSASELTGDTSTLRGYSGSSRHSQYVRTNRPELSNCAPMSPVNLGSSAHRSSAEFLNIVGKSSASVFATEGDVVLSEDPPDFPSPPLPSATSFLPDRLTDANTLDLSSWCPSNTIHRYLASLDLIQKRALVRSLQSDLCAVALVEREALGGMQLIIDHDTAVLFASLAAIPIETGSLTITLTEASWRFMHILLIFEAYPPSQSYKGDGPNEPRPNPFSPPVIKAVQKLRRSLNIAEGCGTKRPEALVSFAFASTVDEAAMLARHFGDIAQSRDAYMGVIWGDREWLYLDEQDGEQELSAVNGMNACAAALILSQVSFDEFLDMDPQQRIATFGYLVGTERIIQFNQELKLRLDTMESVLSGSPSHDMDALLVP